MSVHVRLQEYMGVCTCMMCLCVHVLSVCMDTQDHLAHLGWKI